MLEIAKGPRTFYLHTLFIPFIYYRGTYVRMFTIISRIRGDSPNMFTPSPLFFFDVMQLLKMWFFEIFEFKNKFLISRDCFHIRNAI